MLKGNTWRQKKLNFLEFYRAGIVRLRKSADDTPPILGDCIPNDYRETRKLRRVPLYLRLFVYAQSYDGD